MSRIEELMHQIQEQVPSAELELDRPKQPSGRWWLDVRLGKRAVNVEWRPSVGFGVSSVPSSGYGEGPHEFYDSVDGAVDRIVQVLRHGARTSPPAQVALKRLRERRGISQVELAELMGVRQATISKMENREELNLSTLRRFVAALGGVLQVTARFSDHTVTIDVGNGEEST